MIAAEAVDSRCLDRYMELHDELEPVVVSMEL